MPHTQTSSSGIPAVVHDLPGKCSARALLARRHPLTPREIAHVCTTLLRIAEQVTESDPASTPEGRPDYCMLNSLKENTNA